MRSLRGSIREGSSRGSAGRGARRVLPLRHGNESGFTVVEVLVSTIVLAVLIVPIGNALVTARMFTVHRGEKRMAVRLVERKLEHLMSSGYSSSGADDNVLSTNLDPGAHPVAPLILVNSRGDTDPSNDVYGELTWHVTHDSYPTAGDTVHRKIVWVRLGWPSGAPRDSVSVATVIGA